VCVRGVWYSLHLVSDLASRLALKVERLVEEDQKALKRHFQALLHDWQLKRGQVKLLVTDGASVDGEVLERVLPQAAHQRCVFHLWRNLLPAYQAQAGEQAAQFVRFCLKALWAIPSLDEGYSALEDLERTFSLIPALADLRQTVRRTLREALAHTRHLVEAVAERTSNVAERFFHGYKRRLRMMGCFMSLPGCDHFTAAWQVYTAFQPYQLRKERTRFYRYPGRSPLLIAQAPVEGLSWLDALQI
jgi:transposase-like protein